MSLVFLTESQLHNIVTGKNKAFMTRTINQQKKYGNIDIFNAVIDTTRRTIRLGLGEGSATFSKSYHSGEFVHDIGYLTHIPECTAIVNELANAIGL